VKLSLFTATLSTTMAVIIALPAAYALSHLDFPGKKLIDTLLDLPIVLSPVALGAALLVFFNTWAGRLIEDNVVTFVFQRPGLVLAQFTVVVALAVRLLKSAFDLVDPRYEQMG
jgi:molybdate transport system permease protein